MLRAGRSLILREGPEVSVERICFAAQCSKGAFYHHFSTKRDFLLRVFEEISAPQLKTEELLRLLPATMHDQEFAHALSRPNGAHTIVTAPTTEQAAYLGGKIRKTLST
jgi:AcrR family transcriptional regulator